MNQPLENVLKKNQPNFRPVVNFDPTTDKLIRFDFTPGNTQLSEIDFTDTKKISTWINHELEGANAKFGIGGYNENRTIYRRSDLFDGTEPRSVHLGIDVWGAAGTRVFVPIGGTIHSFAFNDNFGDYGATIIMQHQLDTIVFYTLYGHLSLADIGSLKEGKYISRGELLGHFGEPSENGDWPPHLHFQIIKDMRLNRGDYPGVCTLSESEKYLANCPDPDLVMNIMQHVSK